MSQVRRLDERVSFLLSQLGSDTRNRFVAALAPIGLAPRHFGVLSHLAEADGATQQEVADLLGVHRGVMVGLLDDLESGGLVERRRHPADRRANALHLTPTARRLLARARGVADQLDDDLLAPLDPAGRKALVEALQAMAAAAGLRAGVHPDLDPAGSSGTS